jgi:hypothetical protein
MQKKGGDFVVEDVPVERVEGGKEPIVIGNEILRKGWIARDIRERVPKAVKFVIITDSNVFGLYGQTFISTFEQVLHIKPFVKVLPPGEETKSRQVKEEIEDFMLAKACNRDTCVVRSPDPQQLIFIFIFPFAIEMTLHLAGRGATGRPGWWCHWRSRWIRGCHLPPRCACFRAF